MNHLKFTLALVSVICSTGSVRTWDLGVVTLNEIKLFSNETASTATDGRLYIMTTAAYDPIKKDIYVSDYSQSIGSIFRIKFAGKKAYNDVDPIVAKQSDVVQGIAFDHLTSTLYWITDHGILYVRVPDGEITVPLTGQILFVINPKIQPSIAIDVRRRYLYWTVVNSFNATVERSRLDGSGRQVVVHGDTFIPLAIAVDAENNTLYYGAEHDDMNYSIQSMDLRDLTGTKHMLVQGMIHRGCYIALDDRNVYWSDEESKAVWTVPKISSRRDVSPTLVSKIDKPDSLMGVFSLSGGAGESKVDLSVPSAGSKDALKLMQISSTQK